MYVMHVITCTPLRRSSPVRSVGAARTIFVLLLLFAFALGTIAASRNKKVFVLGFYASNLYFLCFHEPPLFSLHPFFPARRRAANSDLKLENPQARQ